MAHKAKITLTGLSQDLEQRIKPSTDEMNGKTLRVNRETWVKNYRTAEDEMARLVRVCREMTKNEDFRPNAPADCAPYLSGPMHEAGLWKVGKGGVPSVDNGVLEHLSGMGIKLADAIIEARVAINHVSQLKAWQPYADAKAVQPIWDSMGQPQGRYTSDEPCLNNRIVPIRETIEPDEGYSFVSLDLGQCEYVTWASLSKDPVLGAAFGVGKDFHTQMAVDISNLVPEWNLRGETPRAAGKTVNFAILYRMQAWTLSKKLGCSGEVAEKILAAYFNRCSVAKDYIAKVLRDAENSGSVETHFGRRRECSELKFVTGNHKKELQKTVWHHHNAGTAAELLKWKQVRAWEKLRMEGITPFGCRLAMNMFDECIWQVKDDLRTPVMEILLEVWDRPFEDFLPLPVTMKVGKNWKEISK